MSCDHNFQSGFSLLIYLSNPAKLFYVIGFQFQLFYTMVLNMLINLFYCVCLSVDLLYWILVLWYRCDMDEKKDEEESTMNEGEAAVTIAHAKQLIECGVQASDIGIITPYAAQVSLFPSCNLIIIWFLVSVPIMLWSVAICNPNLMVSF